LAETLTFYLVSPGSSSFYSFFGFSELGLCLWQNRKKRFKKTPGIFWYTEKQPQPNCDIQMDLNDLVSSTSHGGTPGNKRPVTVIDRLKYAICSVLTGTHLVVSVIWSGAHFSV
jgi:hypothetical protein